MRRLFLSLICIAFCYFSQAQLSFGPKAGLNLAKISFSSPEFSSKMKPGFYAGGFANYQLNSEWAVQLEVLYSGEGTKEKSTQGNGNGHIHEGLIQLPLLAQYHTSVGFYAEAGPQIGILASMKETYNGETASIKRYYKTAEFRLPFGIGYEFPAGSPVKGLGVNARYSFSFSRINKDLVGGEHLKNSVISIGLFYKIPVPGKH